jgi:hypothetical protein
MLRKSYAILEKPFPGDPSFIDGWALLLEPFSEQQIRAGFYDTMQNIKTPYILPGMVKEEITKESRLY